MDNGYYDPDQRCWQRRCWNDDRIFLPSPPTNSILVGRVFPVKNYYGNPDQVGSPAVQIPVATVWDGNGTLLRNTLMPYNNQGSTVERVPVQLRAKVPFDGGQAVASGIRVLNPWLNFGVFNPAQLLTTFFGQIPIPVGASSLNVPFSLQYAPISVTVGITTPGNPSSIFANVVAGSLTSNGFSVIFDAAIPATGCVLTYRVTGNIGGTGHLPSPATFSGSYAVPVNQQVVVVPISVLTAPTIIQATVSIPPGGDLLFPTPVSGTYTTTSFTVVLSATPLLAGYYINYDGSL